MKYKLDFSPKRVRNDISGARRFKYDDLSKNIKTSSFPVKHVPIQEAALLCTQLDSIETKAASVSEYLKNEEIGIGSKREVDNEFRRARVHTQAQIITLPFKCPVPAKTNYHSLPDFGELMFLYRLGKICKEVSTIRKGDFKITIFEETNALAPVFDITSVECKRFRERIDYFIKSLELHSSLEVRSLQKSVVDSEVEYRKKLCKESEKINKNLDSYKKELQRVLPTIALSVNSTSLSIDHSRYQINKYFSSKLDINREEGLVSTAAKYLAFLKLHKSAVVRDLRCLQFTITPSKNRIGVRPTLKHISILPHHGVPILYKSNRRIKFGIEYYSDFIIHNKENEISEVHDERGKFLFYEVGN